MNAALDGCLQGHKIAAKPHLFPPIADLERGSPDLPPGGRLKRQKTQHVGILLVGLDPAAGVGYIYSYADRKAELTFAKSIVYAIL